MRPLRTALAVVVTLGLLLGMQPPASAGDATNGPVQDVTAQGTTYEYDTYDIAGMGDSTPDHARDITAQIAGYGRIYAESHTLHLVDHTNGDVDWVKFTVTDHDVNVDQTSFLFRTRGTAFQVDTVIEIYGPHATPSFPYTPGHASWIGDSLSITSNDEDEWGSAQASYIFGSAVLFRPSTAGTYYARIRPYAAFGGAYEGSAGPYTLYVKRGILQRLAGADRMQTAIQVSRFVRGSVWAPAAVNSSVVVANAHNFPDALAGSLLAGISGGPLLLTRTASLPAEVGAEIKRLGASVVYVLGSSAAVSDAVFAQIQALDPGITVYRVAGANRYETAAQIAYRANADAHRYFDRPLSKLAVIAYGGNFPDALAASPLAAGRQVPILLTRTASLDPATSAALTTLGITDVVVVGGTNVVSAAVENQLKSRLGVGHVMRIAGGNRYETAKEIASWACDLKGPGARDSGTVGTPANSTLVGRLGPYKFGIASGETYPDALAGGAACGIAGAPLLLNRKDTPYGYITAEHDGWLPAGDTDWVSDFHALNPWPFHTCLLFGGTPTITENTMTVLDNSLMLINAP